MSHSFLTGVPEFRTLALLDPLAAQRLILLQQLQAGEGAAPAVIKSRQSEQLSMLLNHAKRFSTRYRELLGASTPTTENVWSLLNELPPLLRSELQANADLVWSQAAPAHHGPLHILQTSGSSGEPVTVQVSDAAMLIRGAVMLRSYLWHLSDFRQRIAHISAKVAKEDKTRVGVRSEHWESPFFPLYQTGDCVGLNIQTDVARQLEWLTQVAPGVLVTYPSNLQALLEYSKRTSLSPKGIQHVRLNGETVPESLSEQLHEQWGASLSAAYSSEEMGVIAVDCPHRQGLHVMSETVILEVVRDDGSPCSEGEIGRVLVSDLYNFATPMLRYDIRDYAEVGGTCTCGRHLPLLRRVQGRQRNMLLRPDGKRYWPKLGLRKFGDIAPIKQFQVLQLDRERIEIRVAAWRPLSASEQNAIVQSVNDALGYPFDVSLTVYEQALPTPASGKFEEFVSLLLPNHEP